MKIRSLLTQSITFLGTSLLAPRFFLSLLMFPSASEISYIDDL
jgi:hypothetical protein